MGEGVEAVAGVRLIALHRVDGENGSLVVAESPESMPFAARRIFTLFDIPPGEVRGTHAHRACQQLLICQRGSVKALVDDGRHRAEVVLDHPGVALYMPALTWGTQFEYSVDAVLTVLASDPYDADDYIHDYDEFRAIVAGRTAG
jgi:hypothetical protein